MARNGSGTYSLPAGNPVTTGSTISSSWANTTLSDIASALTGSIAADGQTTPTANLLMGTYAHTNVGNATARTMYASAGQVQDSTLTYLTSVAGTNAITASAPIVMTAYAAGQTFRFIAAAANTGATTININSIGLKSITRDGTTALVAGDIVSGGAYQLIYDGTQFQLTNSSNASVQVTSFSAGTTGLTPSTATTGAITLGGTLNVANGGTGLTTLATSRIPYGNGTGALSSSADLTFNGTTLFTPNLILPQTAWTLGTTGANASIVGYGSTGSGGITNNLIFYTGTGERMRISAGGNVGIGTTSPSYPLDIGASTYSNAISYTGSAANGTALSGTNSHSGSYYTLTAMGGTGYGVSGWANSLVLEAVPASTGNLVLGSYSNSVVFQTGGRTERMRIDSSGNLGIGTTSPARKLEIAEASNNYQMRIGAGSVSASYTYDIGRSNSDGFLYFYGNQTGANGYVFSGANGERMRLDTSGNLGLGVTPSAWGSPAKAIELGNGSAFFSYSNPSQTFLTANSTFNGTNWIYKNTAAASHYEQASGLHKWLNAPSGTAGNSITWTTAMTLDASGNLLVGTTSSAGNYKVKLVADSSGSTAFLLDKSASPTGSCLELQVGSNNTTQKAVLVYSTSNALDNFYIYSNGNVVNRNNSYGSISDAKLKENIVDTTPKLNDLLQVKVRNYNLIGSDIKHIGVVAQELEEVFPSMIDESPDSERVTKTREVEVPAVEEVLDEEGNVVTSAVEATTKTEVYTEEVLTGEITKSVKYSVFVPILIKAIQEQQAMIDELKTKVAALEAK